MIFQQEHKQLIFISTFKPGDSSEINSLILAETIRKFSGKLTSSAIWFLIPEGKTGFSDKVQNRLNELAIHLVQIPSEYKNNKPFFMWEVQALAYAEALISDKAEIMVWMDSNTLVLKDPSGFILPPEELLGYTPVHHLLLGSRYDQPLDPFWEEIYKICGVKPEKVFPMKPMVEDIQMRPYFNAGLLINRPETHLFKNWLYLFETSIKSSIIQKYLLQDHKYQIFLHQALLSGVIINQFDQNHLLELPNNYNYPLHLWEEDHTDRRPRQLDQCSTIRHEGLFDMKTWTKEDPFNKDLTRWLIERITFYLE